VEIEWHSVMECATYEDIRSQYENNLKFNNMHQLFDGDKINQITSLLVKIHNKRSDIEKSVKIS
jgi:hypothetical protein